MARNSETKSSCKSTSRFTSFFMHYDNHSFKCMWRVDIWMVRACSRESHERAVGPVGTRNLVCSTSGAVLDIPLR
jgi:hypothetical protein